MNVYCITFPNSKRYVGIESITGNRKSKHSRASNNASDTFVSRAIRKYGWESCVFEYLLKDAEPNVCYQKEIDLIREWDLQNPKNGYNQSTGGESGFRGVKMSDTHKAKIGKAHKGRVFSEETLTKMSIAQKGKKLTDAHKLAISSSLIGNPGHNLGNKHSEESKNKISEALKGDKNPFFGRTHSKETIDKIIASNKRRAR